MQHIPANTPPASRYEGGEWDSRMVLVWAYAVGLMGGGKAALRLSRKVARLHDHKGTLVVATLIDLTEVEKATFRKAWAEVGHEPSEMTIFADAFSDEWEEWWGSRRFDTDWRPGETVSQD